MSLEDDMRALERTPLLGDIGREALRLLAFSAEPKDLRAGDTLFERGQDAEGGYILVSGALVLLLGEEGDEHVVGPGTLLGEVALLAETTRPVTAMARKPSRVLGIPRFVFKRMLGEYPAVAKALHARFLERLKDEHLVMEQVRAKLEALDKL